MMRTASRALSDKLVFRSLEPSATGGPTSVRKWEARMHRPSAVPPNSALVSTTKRVFLAAPCGAFRPILDGVRAWVGGLRRYVTCVIGPCAPAHGWECASISDCLAMTMRFMTVPRYRSHTVRFLGGAALVVLLVGVVFAPLCSALSLCTMPCCHHALTVASATIQNTGCAISRCDAGTDAVAISPAAAPQSMADTTGTAVALTFVPAPNPPVATELTTRGFRPQQRALHILNSAFLI